MFAYCRACIKLQGTTLLARTSSPLTTHAFSMKLRILPSPGREANERNFFPSYPLMRAFVQRWKFFPKFFPNRNKVSGKSRRERERERNKKKKEEKGRDRKEFTQSVQTDGTFTRAIITYRFERNACEREREILYALFGTVPFPTMLS